MVIAWTLDAATALLLGIVWAAWCSNNQKGHYGEWDMKSGGKMLFSLSLQPWATIVDAQPVGFSSFAVNSLWPVTDDNTWNKFSLFTVDVYFHCSHDDRKQSVCGFFYVDCISVFCTDHFTLPLKGSVFMAALFCMLCTIKGGPLCVNSNVSGTVRNTFFVLEWDCSSLPQRRHKTRWSPLLPLSVYEEAQQLFSPCPSRRRFYILMKSPRLFCIVHMPPLPLDSPGVVI